MRKWQRAVTAPVPWCPWCRTVLGGAVLWHAGGTAASCRLGWVLGDWLCAWHDAAALLPVVPLCCMEGTQLCFDFCLCSLAFLL